MSTNLHPQAVKGLFDKRRKSDTEEALERARDHSGRPDDAAPDSGEEIVERAAEQNDRKGRR